jgi:CRISPR-associated protein Cmr2
MHYYDASAHRAMIAPPVDHTGVPRPDEVGLKAKPCAFAIPNLTQEILSELPESSVAINVDFTLVTPYSSKDDMGLEEEHSPIVRDWVYRVPLVRPTTWKGRLRFAAGHRNVAESLITHLFGPDKEAEEKQEGRLHFFPTFFQNQNAVPEPIREIINPHDRISRRGKGPVNITCVRANTPGKFCVLYVGPMDIPGYDAKKLSKEIVSWAKELIEFHGIGAKTLKGYGLGRVDLALGNTSTGPIPIIQRSQGGRR